MTEEKNDLAISVKDLSKVYRLYDNPRDRLKESLHPLRKKYHKDFYALRDISFDIKKGETVGIIGRNGSGKSTLLSIITGVLNQTAGSVKVNGRISSLLELGTGFNPELTGIENVFFNGTILGFTKQEMDQKLDAILAFADIGDFVRQPVKTYSSGMFVRLAFAVAINVDPDVLIIDEALAVGDIRFQQKCFRKINAFKNDGKTILFCSHDSTAILNFCESCFWINEGKLRILGSPGEVVKRYLAWNHFDADVTARQDKIIIDNKTNNKSTGLNVLWRDVSTCAQFGDEAAEIISVAFFDEHYESIHTLKGGEKVNLAIKAKFVKDLSDVIFGFTIKNRHGESVLGINTYVENFPLPIIKAESIEVINFYFELPYLCNGSFSIDVSVASGTQLSHIQHVWTYEALIFFIDNSSPAASFGQMFINSKNITVSKIVSL